MGADPVMEEADVAEGTSVFRTPQNRRSRARRGNGEVDPQGMRSGGQLLPSSSSKILPTNTLGIRAGAMASNSLTPLAPN